MDSSDHLETLHLGRNILIETREKEPRVSIYTQTLG